MNSYYIYGTLAVITIIIIIVLATRKKPDYSFLEEKISNFNSDFSSLKQHYISLSQFRHLQDTYCSAFSDAKSNRKRFSDFISTYEELPKIVRRHNAEFVPAEISACSALFSDIEGKSLDEQQRTAIVTDEDHDLVIAGAGAGKTLTIAGKVKYLCDRKHVDPEDILLLAFGKKAAEEMTDRISHMGYNVNASTFHALGLHIITQSGQQRPDVFDDDAFRSFMEDFFSNRIMNRPALIESIITYFAYYLRIPADMDEFSSFGEAIEYEKNADFETMKSKFEEKKDELGAGGITLQGEYVKSLQELEIANFLFMHGVKYEYERAFPIQDDPYRKTYRPDFYLPDYDIYYEHFGINKNNRLPWLSPVEEQKYLDGIQWKREHHNKCGTKLIETYSYYQQEGILLDKLEEILTANGVKLYPPDYAALFSKIYSNTGEKYFKEFIKLCSTFVQLFKSNGYSRSDLESLKYKSKEYRTKFHKERLRLFKNIIGILLDDYDAELKSQGKVDFSDMINHAADIVSSGFQIHPYKYVIVDEYQDIAVSRSKLLDAILDQSGAHLLCVGDDWQSIYRFTGSDIGLFTGFEKHYKGTSVMRIERTYRNSQQLIDSAARFITKNPAQFKKSLVSSKSCLSPIHFLVYRSDSLGAVKAAIEEIINKYGTDKSIILLGRTNYDLNPLLESGMFAEKKNNRPLIYNANKRVPVEFLTVHRSKGLEADNVIILNFNNSLLGFPNKIADDPLLELVLSSSDTFLYGEERRLLYVALTRTRNEVYLITSETNPSEFKREFDDDPNVRIHTTDFSERISMPCPKCKTGKLVERFSTKYNRTLVGCSNYPACRFVSRDVSVLRNPIRCNACGGFMTLRKGPRGQFYGCMNYPTCQNTMEIPKDHEII